MTALSTPVPQLPPISAPWPAGHSKFCLSCSSLSGLVSLLTSLIPSPAPQSQLFGTTAHLTEVLLLSANPAPTHLS